MVGLLTILRRLEEIERGDVLLQGSAMWGTAVVVVSIDAWRCIEWRDSFRPGLLG